MVHEFIDSNSFQKSNIPKDPEPCTPKKATTETWDHLPASQHTNPKIPSMSLNDIQYFHGVRMLIKIADIQSLRCENMRPIPFCGVKDSNTNRNMFE